MKVQIVEELDKINKIIDVREDSKKNSQNTLLWGFCGLGRT
ncbi:MAG: hypothetical protein ABR980_11130 [Ignavibacteriaceae bacterium]